MDLVYVIQLFQRYVRVEYAAMVLNTANSILLSYLISLPLGFPLSSLLTFFFFSLTNKSTAMFLIAAALPPPPQNLLPPTSTIADPPSQACKNANTWPIPSYITKSVIAPDGGYVIDYLYRYGHKGEEIDVCEIRNFRRFAIRGITRQGRFSCI